MLGVFGFVVLDDEVSDSNSYEVISRADLKMNGGSITTNGINSYGAYANGKKAYINLDYVALETVAVWKLCSCYSTR